CVELLAALRCPRKPYTRKIAYSLKGLGPDQGDRPSLVAMRLVTVRQNQLGRKTHVADMGTSTDQPFPFGGRKHIRRSAERRSGQCEAVPLELKRPAIALQCAYSRTQRGFRHNTPVAQRWVVRPAGVLCGSQRPPARCSSPISLSTLVL